MTATLLIRKDRVGETRLRSGLDAALAAGQVRVAPELLALTANNITYAAFGDPNQYQRCNQDPFWRSDTEAAQALLRPLFTTSWLIDDFMADNGCFGAKRVLLSSASSKTAYGTAFLLSLRGGIEVVGLTSAQNRDFCERLDCYSKVVAYEALAEVAANEPCAYIDFAGNADLRRRVHERFGDRLAYSCAVGASHIDQLGGGAGLPGPRPTPLFASAQAKKLQGEWGGEELQRRLVAAWNEFLARALESDPPWLRVERHEGLPAAQTAYAQLLSGRVDPAQGHVLVPGSRA